MVERKFTCSNPRNRREPLGMVNIIRSPEYQTLVTYRVRPLLRIRVVARLIGRTDGKPAIQLQTTIQGAELNRLGTPYPRPGRPSKSAPTKSKPPNCVAATNVVVHHSCEACRHVIEDPLFPDSKSIRML
jgi:hypothetical protein